VLIQVGVDRGAAQETSGETQPAFVYGINAAIPGNYVGTFAPPSAPAIYLLAGETSVISPRMTEIYFWPITNEYRANWNMQNDPVPGTLEIAQGNTTVAQLESTDYTIQFTQKDGTTAAKMYLGQDARDADARFKQRQEEFQQASHDYYAAEQAWLDAVDAVNKQQQSGQQVDLPPEPVQPEPIGIYSNGLNQGMPIDLEPGQYHLRLRDGSGATVPGSDRELIVFAPRRTGVGYTVVPETRWTTPSESPAPGDVIYGAAGSTLFLEPHLAHEYPTRAWSLLQNPQVQVGDTGGWEWINGERLTDGQLRILADDEVVDRRQLTPFWVEQVPGRQLGYEVHEFVAGGGDEKQPDVPDFVAYPLQLQAPGERYETQLISDQDSVLPGSLRLVNTPTSVPLPRLLILPALPLLLGAVVISRRHRQSRLTRSMAV
jgi:hypothetical protein